ncbi:MAG TPA: DNA methyltransferase, partial [Opitutaceae bacterium]
EHLKRLEGDTLQFLRDLGEPMSLELAGETVDPHQFLGIELNPRAASIAELVLWIGYLQWHHRTRGDADWPEPVLRRFDNIECRDAVLAWDERGFLGADGSFCSVAEAGKWLLRYEWDRKTVKTDPVTAREVPDDKAVVPVDAFRNPRPAEWPQADFIVGNPPFLGTARMREELGEGYTETLRAAYPQVPQSADFVMFWWHKAAKETLAGRARRFGFITTNSIRQTFNRRVVQAAMDEGIYLTFAIPDHPWVDSATSAAVRIAMTVGASMLPAPQAQLQRVTKEEPLEETGENEVQLSFELGNVGSGLNAGSGPSNVTGLKANDGLSSRGMMLGGSGFLVKTDEAKALGLGEIAGLERFIRPYRNGRDLTDKPRHVMAVDLFELTEEALRQRFPRTYEHVLRTVKPERDQNNDPVLRANWWKFRRSNEELRSALSGLPRFIATVETAKHRVFLFLDAAILPDNKLVIVALSDAFHLGVLSSRIHVHFSLSRGALLEDRPVYPKTECFDPFPFPDCTEKQKDRIRKLAEGLDAHRKRAQAQHGLGLTDIYNVLEKLRAGETLTTKDRAINDAALVSTLKQLHDDLDVAVADAYGWPWPMTAEEILERVVALNAKRAADEAKGHIRWLRPDYQIPLLGGSKQGRLALADSETVGVPASRDDSGDSKSRRKAAPTTRKKQPWPASLAERTKAVEAALASAGSPQSAADIAKQFSRAKPADVSEILETLAALGRAHRGDGEGTYLK